MTAVSTQSMLNAFRRCPKKADYAYVQKLRPAYIQSKEKPLHKGTWVHALLERYYKGQDWRLHHKVLCERYDRLSDVEQDNLGDMPTEAMALMRSYLWHYGANRDDPYHGWEIVEVEKVLECAWPNGDTFRIKNDLLVKDQFGLWVVDHKTSLNLPDHAFRLRDIQSVGYVHCYRQNGIPVKGFIWNYLRTKAPTKPVVCGYKEKDGPRLSRKAIDTDFPTMYQVIKASELDLNDYLPQLNELKSRRWEAGKVQTSPFFRRYVMERPDNVLRDVWKSMYHTHRRMMSYPFHRPELVERVVDRSCQFSCQFDQLCSTELFDGNVDAVRRGFEVGDPLDYYEPEKIDG
jgi:hypothetical protein